MNATALETENLRPALTHLSEEEELFRSSFREFAEGEVRPRVEEMEKAGKLDPELNQTMFRDRLDGDRNARRIRRRRFDVF